VRLLGGRFRASLATLIAASGCVLVVSPEATNDHCNFNGTSVCAQCIRAKCQAPVDTCCRDKACVEQGSPKILDALDQCGNGNASSCASSLKSQQQGAAATLRDCLNAQCASECTTLPPDAAVPAVEWKCEAPRDRVTDCAACIYDSCASQIDACCKNPLCTASYYPEMRQDMGACTTGNQRACAFMAYTKSIDGVDGALRACIKTSCGARCVGDALPYYGCTLYQGGTYCRCSAAEKAGSTECSKSNVSGDCIVTDDAKGCVCGKYVCTGAISSCSCSFTGTSAGGSTTCNKSDANASVCCLKVSGTTVTCKCDGDTKCYDAEDYTLSSCNLDAVYRALDAGKRRVERCSN
jgi:hypothetical protein